MEGSCDFFIERWDDVIEILDDSDVRPQALID